MVPHNKPCPYSGKDIEWTEAGQQVAGKITGCHFSDRWRRFEINVPGIGHAGPSKSVNDFRAKRGMQKPHGNDSYHVWNDMAGQSLDTLRNNCSVCHGGP
jgi:hypothetical protein